MRVWKAGRFQQVTVRGFYRHGLDKDARSLVYATSRPILKAHGFRFSRNVGAAGA